ncbi:hypothetical protein Corgl_0723 [Coriobacterium glomerans PW2]|uniref:Uncharacterized protein n=1 Tax=Coriobacterium glomerans (strain ATCC 49209 / DSM 20642 / JCM 10262 / PW2) TaxID=700015 RepID=F2NBM8_CORGP|nr:hypothetical protein Corgl_0723 [Coriobacterium glomerans PW2]
MFKVRDMHTVDTRLQDSNRKVSWLQYVLIPRNGRRAREVSLFEENV